MDGQQPNAQQGLSQQQIQQMQLVVKQALGELLQDDTADMLVKQAQQGNPQEVVARAIHRLRLPVDQCIVERGDSGWVHVSTALDGSNRGEWLASPRPRVYVPWSP